jgi:hypothetical protein
MQQRPGKMKEARIQNVRKLWPNPQRAQTGNDPVNDRVGTGICMEMKEARTDSLERTRLKACPHHAHIPAKTEVMTTRLHV